MTPPFAIAEDGPTIPNPEHFCGVQCLCHTEVHVFRGALHLKSGLTTKQKLYGELTAAGAGKIKLDNTNGHVDIQNNAASCPSCDCPGCS